MVDRVPVGDEFLIAPTLKLERAERHLDELKVRVDAFLAERPFRLMVHRRRKVGRTILRIKTVQPIPSELAVIVGDVVHNLRSALDLTLFPMARDRADKPNRIQFPFPKSDSPKDFQQAFEQGRVHFAGSKVVETIQRTNPCPQGNRALWCISALNNLDKHRLLVLAAKRPVYHAGTNDQELTRILGARIPEGTLVVLGGEDEQDLLTVHRTFATRDLPDSVDEANPQPLFAITFNEPQIATEPIVGGLKLGVRAVREAVQEMVAAFRDPSNVFP